VDIVLVFMLFAEGSMPSLQIFKYG